MGDRQRYRPRQQELLAEQEGMELSHHQLERLAEQEQQLERHPLEGMEHLAACHPWHLLRH